jgi:hypothetical protein
VGFEFVLEGFDHLIAVFDVRLADLVEVAAELFLRLLLSVEALLEGGFRSLRVVEVGIAERFAGLVAGFGEVRGGVTEIRDPVVNVHLFAAAATTAGSQEGRGRDYSQEKPETGKGRWAHGGRLVHLWNVAILRPH